jgi:hypothetical protein
MDKQFEILLSEYLDGDADRQSAARLYAMLKADPVLRKRFCEEIRLHTLLREIALQKAPGNVRTFTMWQQLRKPLAVLISAAAALAIAAGVWWFANEGTKRAAAEVARVVDVQGMVARVPDSGFRIQREGNHEKRGMLIGDVVRAGDRIETGTNGWVKLAFVGEQTFVEEFASSELVCVPSVDDGKKLDLQRGKLTASVAKQKPGKPFVVTTPHACVTVIGTIFEVQVGEKETRVDVKQGIVRLTQLADGAAIEVPAGDGAVAGMNVSLAPKPLPAIQPGKIVFSQDFETIRVDEQTPNELIRLGEDSGEVTTIVSTPFASGSDTWSPDVRVTFGRSSPDDALFAIPENVEFRIRIKSEKAGKWNFQLLPVSPSGPEEQFDGPMLEVGPEWREVRLRGTDMIPYRRAWLEQPTRDFEPGTEICGFAFYGYGTGKCFVDRIEVVSLAGDGN